MSSGTSRRKLSTSRTRSTSEKAPIRSSLKMKRMMTKLLTSTRRRRRRTRRRAREVESLLKFMALGIKRKTSNPESSTKPTSRCSSSRTDLPSHSSSKPLTSKNSRSSSAQSKKRNTTLATALLKKVIKEMKCSFLNLDLSIALKSSKETPSLPTSKLTSLVKVLESSLFFTTLQELLLSQPKLNRFAGLLIDPLSTTS
jgi:hypothetical protein